RALSDEIKKLRETASVKTTRGKTDYVSILENRQKEAVDKILKDIREDVETNINALKSEYDQAVMLAEGNDELREKIEEQYREDVETLTSSLKDVVKRSLEYVKKLHSLELERLSSSFDVDKARVQELSKAISRDYDKVFGQLLAEGQSKISVLKPAVAAVSAKKETTTGKEPAKAEAGREVMKPAKAGKKSAQEIIQEVSAMKEIELLHTLRAGDRKTFMDYLKGEITKDAALQAARRIAAKDLGLSSSDADKYFPSR
ncbi:MAG: hypothetical protein ABIN58_10675, partial [candidate division WOR-3 bacterium]